MLTYPTQYLQKEVEIRLGASSVKGRVNSLLRSGTSLTLDLHRVVDVTNPGEPKSIGTMSVEWNDAYKISIAN